MSRDNYSLLPFVREDVYGLDNSSQTMGWELTEFNIPSLWSVSQGDNVRVAVIDTGCDFNHPDIKSNILEGKNFIDLDKEPMDDNGHGTHVSGTIAASNNRVGMVGVAPKTKIIPVKALNAQGTANSDSIVKAIEWSANIGVDFITMSLGSSKPSKLLENAINYAVSKGCIIFCAAGNNGSSHDILYPAKYDGTISIGAIDRNLERTNFTCSGDTLDFLAPGHEIVSCVPNNSYAIMSGTSMSNPFAVGCASLLLSYAKATKFKQTGSLKTYKDYINIFSKYSLGLKNPLYHGKRQYEGYGIIQPIKFT